MKCEWMILVKTQRDHVKKDLEASTEYKIKRLSADLRQ